MFEIKDSVITKLNFRSLRDFVLKNNSEDSLYDLLCKVISEDQLKQLSYDEISYLFDLGSAFMQGSGMSEFFDENTPLYSYLICGVVFLIAQEHKEIEKKFKFNLC